MMISGRQRVIWKLEDIIIKERRLRWLGHVLRMEDSRVQNKQCVHYQSRISHQGRNGNGSVGHGSLSVTH